MNCRFEKEWWAIDLNEAEAKILADSFSELAEHYRTPLDQLSENAARHWRGRITKNDVGEMNLKEEQQHLEEERLMWKSSRLAVVEKWLKQYQLSGIGKKWTLSLSPEEMEMLLCIMNDRRLTLACQHNFNERDMEKDPRTELNEVKRFGIWEIHLLGLLQENILASLRQNQK